MRSLRRLFSRRSGPDPSRDPSPEAMACQSAVELLSCYLDDDLGADERRRLETHLAGCGHCAEYLAQLRASIAVVARTEDGPLDPGTRAALTDLYRSWQDEEKE